MQRLEVSGAVRPIVRCQTVNEPVEEWLFSDETGIFTKLGLRKLTLKKLKYIAMTL